MDLSRRELLASLAALPAARLQDDRAAVLEKLLAELESSAARFYNVPREDGRFLNALIRLKGARRALEVGTANGYSAIWQALALEETEGKLTTIEIKPELVRTAKENLAKVRLADRVTFLEGDAHKIVRTLEGPFDYIFIDADMGNDLDYLNVLLPKLDPGGLLLRHNAITYANTMKDFLEAVQKHPELDSMVLSLTMKDGFSLSLRKRKK